MSLTKDQLDAIQAGDTVAVSSRNGVNLREVIRLTKTMIVLNNGARFNRHNGFQVGGDQWSMSYLNLPDHPQIVQQLKNQRRDNLSRILADRVAVLRDTPTQFNLNRVTEVLAQIQAYIED